MDPLLWAAARGPWVLVAGLMAGLALPGLAEPLRPALPVIVVILLFISSLRLTPDALRQARHALPLTLRTVLIMQLGAPLLVVLAALSLGYASTPAVIALILMLTAPSIMGSPNISIMLGAAPDHALRLMILGTALLPFSVWPVFLLTPGLGDPSLIARSAGILGLTVAITMAIALVTRQHLLGTLSPRASSRLDGLSAITLAVFVIGLMPQVSSIALQAPWSVASWAVFALSANFGAQALAWLVLRRKPRDIRLPTALIAGNRNIALFLVSLPPEVTAPLLVFIGCYQLPMYLTPLMLRRLYRG